MKIQFWGVRGSVPAPVTPMQIQSKISAIIQRISPKDVISPEAKEKFISTIACKVAEEARNAVDRADAEDLINELLALPNPFACPHGKSTAIKMSKYDIERKFARK